MTTHTAEARPSTTYTAEARPREKSAWSDFDGIAWNDPILSGKTWANLPIGGMTAEPRP